MASVTTAQFSTTGHISLPLGGSTALLAAAVPSLPIRQRFEMPRDLHLERSRVSHCEQYTRCETLLTQRAGSAMGAPVQSWPVGDRQHCVPRVVGPADEVAAIGHVARRIRRFAEAIDQAHRFEIGPGDHTEAWSLEFQQQAVHIYASVLPWSYLLGLASGFRNATQLMDRLDGPTTAAIEWTRMRTYLSSAAQAIYDDAPPNVDAAPKTADQLLAQTPPVMPFDRLALILSTEGAATLRATGAAIEGCCAETLAPDPSPLTDQEADWLGQLASGIRTLDIARESGYSERSLYRALADLYKRLGVRNRQEALTLAIDRSWISP